MRSALSFASRREADEGFARMLAIAADRMCLGSAKVEVKKRAVVAFTVDRLREDVSPTWSRL